MRGWKPLYDEDPEEAARLEEVLARVQSPEAAASFVRHYSLSEVRRYIVTSAGAKAHGSWTSDPDSGGKPLVSDGGTDLGCYWVTNTDPVLAAEMYDLAAEYSDHEGQKQGYLKAAKEAREKVLS